MDMQELLDLISIRSYVVNAVANPTFDKATVRVMDGMLILLDKRIAAIITSAEFKDYIGYTDVRKAIEEVVNQNNIKSGLRRNSISGQLEKIPK